MISDSMLHMIEGIKAKRPRTVLDHIVKHGFITTDELKTIYGYNHPPRAARDVRECGIPLETFRVTGPDGRRIAAYRFGDDKKIEAYKIKGRQGIPKSVKTSLFISQQGRCSICGQAFPQGALQVDHRLPYEVAGDSRVETFDAEFMLVCGACNRAKSWSCEACVNWVEDKDIAACEGCLWASPEDYCHIGLEERRSLTVGWSGSETSEYDALRREADSQGCELASYIKRILAARCRSSES